MHVTVAGCTNAPDVVMWNYWVPGASKPKVHMHLNMVCAQGVSSASATPHQRSSGFSVTVLLMQINASSTGVDIISFLVTFIGIISIFLFLHV